MWPIEPRVRSLTGYQLAKLGDVGDEWAALANSIAESNRNQAESAARRLYDALSQRTPPIFWVRSPDELRLARLLRWAEARTRPRMSRTHSWHIDWPMRMLGEPLIRDYLLASGEIAFDAWWPIETMACEVAEQVRGNAMERLELEIARATDRMIGSCTWRAWPGEFFGTLAALDFVNTYLLRELATPRCRALVELFRYCGFCFPEHDACWLIERPMMIVMDAQQRLHCEVGPAITYRDGWSAYYLNGCWVPEHVVTSPASITLEDIAMQHHGWAREEMIRRFGIERYLLAVGAEVISDDEFGTLYRLGNQMNRRGRQILRVMDATPCAGGSRKEFFLQVPLKMKTSKEAVAWTFYLAPEQYSPSLES